MNQSEDSKLKFEQSNEHIDLVERQINQNKGTSTNTKKAFVLFLCALSVMIIIWLLRSSNPSKQNHLKPNAPQEKHNLTQEQHNLTKEHHNLTQEQHNLTKEHHNLTQEQHNLPQGKQNITKDGPFLKIIYEHQVIETKYPNPIIENFIQKQRIGEEKLPLLDLSNQAQIKSHIKKMKKGQNDNSEFASFLYKKVKDKSDELTRKAEYMEYEEKYNLGSYKEEIPICVIAAGRNILRKKGVYQQFLYCLERQNYTNFKVVITDDQSTDNTYQEFRSIIFSLPRLKQRTILIKNIQNIGALANKDMMIRNHCSAGQIVFDVDADDFLVGVQVLNLINTLYQSTGKWFIYSNLIRQQPGGKVKVGNGRSISPEIFKKNNYRTVQNNWVTSELRTYLRDLYVKIPPMMAFEDLEQKKYFIQASDRAIMYSIAELAGENKTKFIPQYLYFYNENQESKQCFTSLAVFDEYKIRLLTPLKALSSLNQQAKQMQNYEVPEETRALFRQKKDFYEECKRKGQI